MGKDTKIQWADDTLNLWWGCTKVSDGCKNCHAEHLADGRFGRNNWGPSGIRQEVKSWRSTLARISKEAKTTGVRRKVFVNSMSDTFEGPETMGGETSANWSLVQKLRGDLAEAIQDHPELDFLLLTKRPQNILQWAEHCCFTKTRNTLFENCWIGTSVEDQETATKRIPNLIMIPAKVRFLSCEPLIGPVTIGWALGLAKEGDTWAQRADLNGIPKSINWVIVGGESGPKARPMHPLWAESLRDQCQAAHVPFFFKQWGEWCPSVPSAYTAPMYRAGKHHAGRLLAGREWNEYPLVSQ